MFEKRNIIPDLKTAPKAYNLVPPTLEEPKEIGHELAMFNNKLLSREIKVEDIFSIFLNLASNGFDHRKIRILIKKLIPEINSDEFTKEYLSYMYNNCTGLLRFWAVSPEQIRRI